MLPYVALYFMPFPGPVTFLAISPNTLQKEGFILLHSLRTQSILVVKPSGWELEAAGHISSVRTQRRGISVASSFAPFTSAQDPSPWNGVAHS